MEGQEQMVEGLLAWIHWDPDSIAFMIPWLEHPVRWYGIFFVIGFAISYFIMLRLLAHKIDFSRRYQEADVLSWDRLLASLQAIHKKHTLETVEHILHHLSGAMLKELESWKPGGPPSERLKSEVLVALNTSLKNDSEFEGKRTKLDGLGLDGLRTAQEHAYELTDRLTVYVILGTVIGARLGHIFFYDLAYYLADPIRMLKVWQGGLASHGGAIGIIIAIIIFRYRTHKEYPSLSLLNLLDYLAICAGLVGAFIRLGNFFNQEILGHLTTVPWAVVFGHAADNSPPMPRHPVQLYEAFFYVVIFVLLLKVWLDRGGRLCPGRILGAFFTLVFSFRFLIEFFKEGDVAMKGGATEILMGQVLSVPFILIGIYLWFFKKNLQTPGYFS